MKFVQVERTDGTVTYIHTGHVQYFEAADGGSRVQMDDGDTVLTVIHPPDVLAQIFARVDHPEPGN